MTYEQKKIVKAAAPVHRRGIYEFYTDPFNPGTNYDPVRYALVVSAGGRDMQDMQSIIILASAAPDAVALSFEVGIRLPNGGPAFFINCSKVTYCPRSRLGKEIFTLSKNTMQHVNKKMREQLGISVHTTEELPEPGETDYKALYEGLLESIAKGRL